MEEDINTCLSGTKITLCMKKYFKKNFKKILTNKF